MQPRPILEAIIVLVVVSLLVWCWCFTPPRTANAVSINPPAYCYSNSRGMGFLCADLKGEFNV